MLSSGNSKYLSAQWMRDRAKALWDRGRFTTAELVVLDVGASEGYGKNLEDTMCIKIQPLDANTTTTRKYDMRKRPECGD